jgi:peptide-methionine (R)-S-oxide reductase
MDRRSFLKSSMIWGGLAALSGVLLSEAGDNTAAATDGAAPVPGPTGKPGKAGGSKLPFEKVVKTDAEWKQVLTPEQYHITREGGTEAPFTSPLNDVHDKGVFECVCCDLPLFSSKAKFDSKTGWPSFYQPIAKINVREKTDRSLVETRTEILCNRCDAHLGHVFDDGPEPTGLRYCMNGLALKFVAGKSDKL